MQSVETKPCPYCAEEIRKDAKICRFCMMDLITGRPIGQVDDGKVEVSSPHQVKARSGVADGVKIGCGMFIVLPLLILVGLVVLAAIFVECGSY